MNGLKPSAIIQQVTLLKVATYAISRPAFRNIVTKILNHDEQHSCVDPILEIWPSDNHSTISQAKIKMIANKLVKHNDILEYIDQIADSDQLVVKSFHTQEAPPNPDENLLPTTQNSNTTNSAPSCKKRAFESSHAATAEPSSDTQLILSQMDGYFKSLQTMIQANAKRGKITPQISRKIQNLKKKILLP